MAKKKSKGKKKSQSHKKTETKKSHKKEKGSSGWIVGVIIVIVIIIAIVLLMRGTEKEPEQPPVTPPEDGQEDQEEQPSEEEMEEVSGEPTLNKKCSEGYVLGWPEFEVNDPCVVESDSARISLKYSGNKDSLSGVWFKITTKNGDVRYMKDGRDLEKGEVLEYSIPSLGDDIENVLAMPLIEEGGEDKACLNQRLIIVKSTNCIIG